VGATFGSPKEDDSKKNGDSYNTDGIDLVYVEGTGSVQSFYIGKYEVTQTQWEEVMSSNPSYNKADNNPVEQVNWDDVQEFLNKLNAKTGRTYRLPTEAEWLYAANGGLKKDTYKYAGSDNINDVAWYRGNSGGTSHAVGTKSPNALGIYDMSGNVWEWCADCGDSNCLTRINRGGSWDNAMRFSCIAYRDDTNPRSRHQILGFRVVLP
jgi:formylglycine-generating enzyme required for sulfatase activity